MTEAKESPVAICWECEAKTNQPFTVAIPTLADHRLYLVLCPTCYHACYLSLAVEIRTSSGS